MLLSGVACSFGLNKLFAQWQRNSRILWKEFQREFCAVGAGSELNQITQVRNPSNTVGNSREEPETRAHSLNWYSNLLTCPDKQLNNITLPHRLQKALRILIKSNYNYGTAFIWLIWLFKFRFVSTVIWAKRKKNVLLLQAVWQSTLTNKPSKYQTLKTTGLYAYIWKCPWLLAALFLSTKRILEAESFFFFFSEFFFSLLHEAPQYLKASCSLGFCYVPLCTVTEIHEGLEWGSQSKFYKPPPAPPATPHLENRTAFINYLQLNKKNKKKQHTAVTKLCDTQQWAKHWHTMDLFSY